MTAIQGLRFGFTEVILSSLMSTIKETTASPFTGTA
ncbi:hypothetical protein Goshw_020676 [Gossypium schwendimanii]|uniref:Uncharacterized protein n=1 Tax=Gossypium schwendimanii TaxID=34291 RepID=A0A7J9M7M4_GOSSC|nr:hypothetical protein [Gossypium schwendimanii]